MDPKQLRKDTYSAISSIEDCSGIKVVDYRAPAFSIGENNKWAVEVLAECGIERDSSFFPAKRDFGGFHAFPIKTPTIVEYNGVRIKEFPIMLASLLGKQVAYSGGGYFRLFPYSFVFNTIKKNRYNICYFHIADLSHNKEKMMTRKEYETYFQEPGSLMRRILRHFKATIGTKGAFAKMENVLDDFVLVNLEQADKAIDWNRIEVVKL